MPKAPNGLNNMNPSPSLKVHPIQINDIEFRLKGLFAIIPAFNQELLIGSVILQTKPHVDRIIVVDDGSSDRTSEVARIAGAEVIKLDHTTGKSYALLLGLRLAYEQKCNIAVSLDANGQHNPVEIARVVGQIIDGNADVVIGSRYLNRLDSLQSYEKYYQMQLESGTIITDSTSSFLAFSRKALSSLDFPTEGLKLNRDLISHLDKQGLNISEVSITRHKRQIASSTWDFPIKVLAAMPAYNEEKYIGKQFLQHRSMLTAFLLLMTDLQTTQLKYQKNGSDGRFSREKFWVWSCTTHNF